MIKDLTEEFINMGEFFINMGEALFLLYKKGVRMTYNETKRVRILSQNHGLIQVQIKRRK